MMNFESRIDELRRKFEGILAGVKDAKALEDLRNGWIPPSKKRQRCGLPTGGTADKRCLS